MSRVEDNYKFALEEGNRKIEGSTTECAMQLSTMLIRVLLDQFLKMAHSLRMIEFNAYSIAEEMKTLRGD